MKKILIPLCIVISICSCKVIQPLPPNLPPSQLPSSPLPDSKIDVPVTYDLTWVFNDFNSLVPPNYSGGGNVGPGSYSWNVQRAPFNLSVMGNALTILDQAHCYGEGDISVFGHPRKVCSCDVNANIGIKTTFNLAANYFLSGNAALNQFDVTPCKLTFANFDVTPILKNAATNGINKGLATVNQRISQYSIAAPVQSAWNTLSQPISIPGIGFLLLKPSAVRMETPTGNGNLLNFPIGLTAEPQLYSTNPGQQQPAPLPNISNAAGSGFNIILDATLDYVSINKDIAAQVKEKTINYPKGYIQIKDLELFGVGNDHIIIKVGFKGKYGWVSYKGLLYFTGIPIYDPQTGNLFLTKVDFDTNTSQTLTDKGASWILNAVIKTFFDDQVHTNISSTINTVKNSLVQAINKPVSTNVTLAGTVNILNFQGILPQKDSLLIRLTTSGTLSASVK